MSDLDPRAEAARIVAAARRWIERERAAGLDDSALSAALVASRESKPMARESRGATGAASSGSLPEVDLFGAPVKKAAAGPTIDATEAAPLTTSIEYPFDDELHPSGVEVRAEIVAAARGSLEQIAAEARACRACGLCETRTQAVPGVGSAESGIVFVGEAPGADEDRRGEPFVGRAGELLTKIIQAMDDARLIPGVPLRRDTVYICNVLKCRPPENRNPLPHEVEACAPFLKRQLEALRPRVICCLGKFAAELLVGVKGTIGGLRGKVYRYRGSKLIVTYHPAACLRNPAYKRPVWEDMQLLAREYLAD